MTTPRGSALLRGLAAVGVLLATLAVAVPEASATGLNNRLVAGVQSEVGCLTTQLCVVGGYNNRGVGDIEAVRDGLPGRVSALAGTEEVSSISCPNPTGCVALGRPSSAVGIDFVTINKAGVVDKADRMSLPSGVSLTRIDCQTLTSCEVAGLQIFTTPATVEVGTWSAGRLVLHRVGVPSRSTDTVIEGLSCFKATCDVVGYFGEGAVDVGLSITITAGTHARLRTVGHDSLYGIACISAVHCYADGYGTHGGLVVTLTNGVASKTVSTRADLFGIACAGTACTGVGEALPPAGSSNAFWGQVLTIAAGAISSTVMVSQSGGYDAVARVANIFCAVGPTRSSGSEVTTN
jgi:hypothetical protein